MKKEIYKDPNTKGRLDYQEKVNAIIEIFSLNFIQLTSPDNGVKYNVNDVNNFLNECKDYLMKHITHESIIQSDEINESINKLKINFVRFL